MKPSHEAKENAKPRPFVDPADDMHDAPDDLPANPLLRRALLHWQRVAAPYWEANHKAQEDQRRHRFVVTFAAVLGSTAVVMAILQLASRNHEPAGTVVRYPATVEVLAAALAALAVVLGVWAGFMEEWLIQRHKAERMRLLKYRSLLELALFEPTQAGFRSWEEQVEHELNRINRDTPERWSEEDQLSDEPAWAGKVRMSAGDLQSLVTYYRAHRLETQTDYFFRRARSNTQRDARSRQVPLLLFAASILCALAHFGLDSIPGRWHIADLEPVSQTLIVLAAIFPVVGAAVRTYRGAHEFSRNTTRFWAKYIQLKVRRERLGIVTSPEDILRELWQSESTLEQEHREWLRLMKEAEWFG